MTGGKEGRLDLLRKHFHFSLRIFFVLRHLHLHLNLLVLLVLAGLKGRVGGGGRRGSHLRFFVVVNFFLVLEGMAPMPQIGRQFVPGMS